MPPKPLLQTNRKSRDTNSSPFHIRDCERDKTCCKQTRPRVKRFDPIANSNFPDKNGEIRSLVSSVWINSLKKIRRRGSLSCYGEEWQGCGMPIVRMFAEIQTDRQSHKVLHCYTFVLNLPHQNQVWGTVRGFSTKVRSVRSSKKYELDDKRRMSYKLKKAYFEGCWANLKVWL